MLRMVQGSGDSAKYGLIFAMANQDVDGDDVSERNRVLHSQLRFDSG